MKNSHYNHYVNIRLGFGKLDIIFLRKHKGAEAQEPAARPLGDARHGGSRDVKENSY